MNKLYLRKFFLIAFVLSLTIGSCNAQIFHKSPEKKLFGKTLGHKKEAKVKEPRTILKARKKQEAKEKKLNKDKAKSVKRSRKRTLDIQTPEVQARMKQNQKDFTLRDKAKKKNTKATTKKARNKYK
jgi:hypothetical protein